MIRFAEGGRQRIFEQGVLLFGEEDIPQTADVLLDGVIRCAAAFCGRSDIPESMEWPLAVLFSRVLQDGEGRPVTSVKRGDTAVTYADRETMSMETLLSPFVRLQSPRRRMGGWS